MHNFEASKVLAESFILSRCNNIYFDIYFCIIFSMETFYKTFVSFSFLFCIVLTIRVL